MAKNIYLQEISIDKLKFIFSEIVKNELKNLFNSYAFNSDILNSEHSNYLTPFAAAKMLGVSKVTLWKYTKSGKLPSYHILGKLRYKRDDLNEAIQAQKSTAADTQRTLTKNDTIE